MDRGPKVIAITGISGLIGRELALQLDVDDDVEKVLGIDIADFKRPSSKFVFVKRSVTEPLGDLFLEHKVEAAIHLAFLVNPIRDRAAEERVNVGGSQSFLDACSKAKVPIVCVVSSATAYGARADNPAVLYEGAPLRADPAFPYAHDKARVEELCYEFAKKNPDCALAIVRPSVVVGPHAQNFMTRLLDGRFVLAPMGFDPPIQFVHEDDVVRAIHRIVKFQRVGVFNVAADGALTLARMAELADRTLLRLPRFALRFLAWLGWKLGLGWLSEAPPAYLDYVCYPWCVSNIKLKTEVGFIFKHDALHALHDYLEARTARLAGRPRVRVEVDPDDLDELEAADAELEGSGSSEDVTEEDTKEAEKNPEPPARAEKATSSRTPRKAEKTRKGESERLAKGEKTEKAEPAASGAEKRPSASTSAKRPDGEEKPAPSETEKQPSTSTSASASTKRPEGEEKPAASEAAKAEAPKTDAPKADAPRADAPKTERVASDTPKVEAPKTEPPKTEPSPPSPPAGEKAAETAADAAAGSAHAK